MNKSTIDTVAALKYFKKTDFLMYQLLKVALKSNNPISLPKPKLQNEYFDSIVSSIVSQQINTRAAHLIFTRIKELLSEITPEKVLEVDLTKLKACGLSEQKTNYIKNSAELWNKISYRNFVQMEDEEIITELIRLPGIGRWTAEMFLIFSLARPDVFSFGDFGLKQSLYQNYNYKKHWNRKIRTTVENLSPHRTLALLALWHAKDNKRNY